MFGAVQNNPGFKGRAGTFYFDERLDLRRGRLELPSDTLWIALWDAVNPGLWNDCQDGILIDYNRDGRFDETRSNKIFFSE